MRVLIVARTRMRGDRVCVGGLDVQSGTSLRLLGRDEDNLHEDHPVRPGEIWDIVCSPRTVLRPPHVEDVVVRSGKRLSVVTALKQAILDLVHPWDCALDEIFDGRLVVTESGTAFLRDELPYPTCSTGFWLARRAVPKSKFEEFGDRYWFPDGSAIRTAKYVGMDQPVMLIPEGALIRFSLARWGEFPPGIGEKRCYLQLSGWYI